MKHKFIQLFIAVMAGLGLPIVLWSLLSFSLVSPVYAASSYDITIVAGSSLVNINQVGRDFTANGDNATLGVNNITTALGAGDVTVSTGGGGSQSGNITMTAQLDYNGIGLGKTLTLSAANNITINSNILDSVLGGDSLNLNLLADADNDGGGSISTAASILIDSKAAITMTANAMTFNSASVISGTDTIRLQPRNPSANFSLSDAEVVALADGFSQITIGRDDSSGQISLTGGPWSFNDPVLIQAPASGGTIDTTANILDGQDDATITLQADQNIDTADITNENRQIEILSANGGVNAGNLETDTLAGNGGPVIISASTTITAGSIETNSGFGNGDGGDVTLLAGDDIELSYVKTGNGGTDNGGGINISGRFVRLTGWDGSCDPSNCSVESTGNVASGVITITHQGNGVTPFIVGDAAVNGSAGNFWNYAGSIIMTTQTFYGSHTQPGTSNTYIITVVPPSDLAIAKSVNPTTAAPGETINYTLSFTNIGTFTATSVTITDTFPTDITVSNVSSSGLYITETSGYPNYAWQVENMGVGSSGVITIQGDVAPPTPSGTLTNMASITSTNDLTPTNNNASVGLNVIGCVGTVVYVNRIATGSENGSSWTDAFTKLQDGLIQGAGCPGVTDIWVAKGVYYPDEGRTQTDNDRYATFHMTSTLAVYGGFNGSETLLSQQNYTSNITVLSGDIDDDDTTNANNVVEDTNDISDSNSYHVVTTSDTDNTAILDGFTVTAGQANDAGGDENGGGLY
ncbi:DUF11 domain-containing protein, partial [Anaerolineales bacterium HSG6]|nr:DUF11 domain-containing protein [Anaerolineales bacterium HSG6]